MKNKKGLSAIISLLLLILIVSLGTVIIWKTINSTIEKELEETKSCYDLLGKTKIESKHTCYDLINKEMRIFISVENIKIEELLLAIYYENASDNFRIYNESSVISNLRNYDGSYEITIPEPNSGKTYIAEEINEMPVRIEISPMFNENFCEGDSFTAIDFCH